MTSDTAMVVPSRLSMTAMAASRGQAPWPSPNPGEVQGVLAEPQRDLVGKPHRLWRNLALALAASTSR